MSSAIPGLFFPPLDRDHANRRHHVPDVARRSRSPRAALANGISLIILSGMWSAELPSALASMLELGRQGRAVEPD